MLRRGAWLTSRRAAAALRTHKPSTTHVTADGIDGASVGISLPEPTIVPEAVAFRPETYFMDPTIYVDDLNQKVTTSSSGIIPAHSMAPRTASISPLSIGTNLVGGSRLLEFGDASPTASIESIPSQSPIKTSLEIVPIKTSLDVVSIKTSLDVVAMLELPKADEADLVGISSLLNISSTSPTASMTGRQVCFGVRHTSSCPPVAW